MTDSSTSSAGGIPRPTRIDDRKEPRIPVSWRGQLALPNGQRSQIRVRDVSESGIGLVCPDPVANMSIVTISMGVPDLIDPTRSINVVGQLRAMYVVIQGHDYRVGGQWVELPAAQREMLKQVIKRHRFG